MRILFLDDDPQRHFTFQRCTIGRNRTQVEAVDAAHDELLNATDNHFDIVSLDHDLEGKIYQPSDEKSGAEVCRFLATMPVEALPQKIILHSFNPTGVSNMMNILMPISPYTLIVVAPFGSDAYWQALSE